MKDMINVNIDGTVTGGRFGNIIYSTHPHASYKVGRVQRDCGRTLWVSKVSYPDEARAEFGEKGKWPEWAEFKFRTSVGEEMNKKGECIYPTFPLHECKPIHSEKWIPE